MRAATVIKMTVHVVNGNRELSSILGKIKRHCHMIIGNYHRGINFKKSMLFRHLLNQLKIYLDTSSTIS